jgi:prolyl oligopeptidase PreP (S9A serine peptidase family)
LNIAPAKDGIAGARFTPDGLYILFLRDKDRNENYQIYRATTDGKEVVPLTQEPNLFHHLPRVSADWKTMAYIQGDHKSGQVRLVTQPLEGGKPQEVMTGEGVYELMDLSPDGNRALVSHAISLSRSELISVDLKSGKTTVIAPHKDKQANAPYGVFSADGKSIYVVTDEGHERAALHRVDAQSGATQATFLDPLAEITKVLVSHGRPIIAVELNYGDHSSLKLLHPTSLKEKPKVKVPLGTVTIGNFSPDGLGLVINVSTPSSPSEIYWVATNTGKLKALRQEIRPTLRQLASIHVTTERIASFDKLKIPLNIYLPRAMPAQKKLPVIVSVHGGPAYSSRIGWNALTSFWVSRGFAVVEPNVRGSTGFGKKFEMADNGPKRMDVLKDLDAVNQWIRRQKWADSNRLVIYGGSYGGYLAYLALGHQPKNWQAAISLVGMSNLVTFIKSTTKKHLPLLQEEFGTLEHDAKFLAQISPIRVVDQMQSPIFVYQGQNDPRSPRAEQDQIVLALRQRHIPVEYMVAMDEGHSLSQRQNRLEFVGRSMRFLEQHLDLPGISAECKEQRKMVANKKAIELKKAGNKSP